MLLVCTITGQLRPIHIINVIDSLPGKYEANQTSLMMFVVYCSFFISSIVGARSPSTASTYNGHDSNEYALGLRESVMDIS